MMTRRMILRLVVSVTLLLGVMDVAAQMTVIPRERIDSIARPRTVTDSGMTLIGGEHIDLGDIVEADGVVERVLEWENKGQSPIVITRVKSSCSCVTVTATRDVIAPSQRGRLTLRFNPSRRLGGISYRVLIYSSLSDELPTAVLNISGKVLSSVEGRSSYPEQCGALLLESRRVRLSEGDEVHIACMNGGEQSLTLSEDNRLTPEGLTLRCEPEVLRAGERGEIIIECESVLGETQQIMLYIKGLSLPPRQRLIVVELEK